MEKPSGELRSIRPAAIYDRKRASTACSVCRARKTKCDSERPVCGFCRASGGNCRYPEPDASKLDQGSLEILTRINQLEQTLKSHISQALNSKPNTSIRGAFLPISQLQDRSSGYHSTSPSMLPTLLESSGASEHVQYHHQIGQLDPVSQPFKIGSTTLPMDVPPSTEILSHASDMSLEAVLKWPIFLGLLPHLATELHTPTTEVLAKDGPIATVTEQDIDMALQNLRPGTLDHLVDNFLANNNIKNPVLDSDTLRTYVQEFNMSRPQWDGKTCLILLVCAISVISNSLEQELEPGVSKSDERLKMAEAYFQASQRRIGMLHHENSILAGQCTFLTGVYLCSTNQIISGWKAFVHASNQCLALLRSNGRLQPKESLFGKRDEQMDSHANIGSQDVASQRYVEESLYWGCLKSEIEVRFELCLPGSGLDRFDYPIVYPSPPVNYHQGGATTEDSAYSTMTPFVCSGHKDHHSIEIGWLYYLAEIATKRIRSNVWAESYTIPAVHTSWALQLDKRVTEFEWQIQEWYKALPEQVKFPIDPLIPTRSITRYILRHHMFDIQEDVRFPAIQALLGSSFSSQDLKQLSPVLTKLSREFLSTAVNRIRACSECFYHRHHGQWFGIRGLGRNALQILGMACKCRQDVGDDDGVELEKQFLPPGWNDAIHLALTYFEYWSNECADARRMGKVITELLRVYQTLAHY
ncbi:uncharacterized protein BP5553_06157 [Venustampulla echinocandica]|uniref:Zn(2)-C6 fungal-type domain-containing protein n=1 Tax=Venustampulla echinocandica TaxID=2656787 RepID=A0A370TMR1_9HELO|nr:uncharacterized protein BP5553_06157 [Venustampulla echinocandica]RDL36805.1 hypothetical protein BP5553_06157 [Venustampulla echinocandica]